MMNKKTVQFDDSKTKVHNLITWSYAYRQARKGLWQKEMADRMRFQRRIDNTQVVLQDILDIEHRLEVYRLRFA